MYITVHEPDGPKILKSEKEYNTYASNKIVIEAGGGMVFNRNGELLLMFRRGQWDMPKGKIDQGETIEECALREVTEETGLKDLRIIKKLQTTYHTYFYKGEPALKPSHWFLMEYPGNDDPIPQTEEDITEIKWVDKKTANLLMNNAYPSIKEMVEKYFLNQP